MFHKELLLSPYLAPEIEFNPVDCSQLSLPTIITHTPLTAETTHCIQYIIVYKTYLQV